MLVTVIVNAFGLVTAGWASLKGRISLNKYPNMVITMNNFLIKISSKFKRFLVQLECIYIKPPFKMCVLDDVHSIRGFV